MFGNSTANNLSLPVKRLSMDTNFGVFMINDNNGQLAMIVSYKDKSMADDMCKSLNRDNGRLHMRFFVSAIVVDGDK